MKTNKLILAAIALFISGSMLSCKKDYSCTCTTTVLGVSATKTYDLPNQTKKDATEACDRYETDANNSGIGTTNCHL